MRKVYVDAEHKCHTTNPDGIYKEIEHPFFEGKCNTFIDGYCYDTSKGYAQIYPWKPFSELDAAQREHERHLLAEYEAALAEIEAALGV